MEDSNTDDLPPGWSVEVKVRKNGQIDKYYYPPSSGLKFNSKVKVFRYLEKKAQNKVSKQRISENVEVEEGVAEALPQGSMKMTRITTNRSRAKSLDQKDGMVGLAEGAIVLSCADEVSQEKQLQVQNRRYKNKYKEEANLPRRASKRLAGIKADELPELQIQTRSRARRDAAKQSDKEETIINADKSANNSSNDRAKQFHALDGSETKCKSDANITENEHKIDAKIDYRLNFPLKELVSDPCIAFAIQTLTGVPFEICKNTKTSSEFKSSQHCETSASAEDGGKKINFPDGDSAGCNVSRTDEKANENAGSSSEKTLGTSWMDPCIEFAIKTLTSPTIPLDSDQNPKTCFQQQLSSSNNQNSEMALSSFNFGTQKKPMLNQSCVDPTEQHTRSIGIGNSTGA